MLRRILSPKQDELAGDVRRLLGELERSLTPGAPPRTKPLTLAELCAGPDADTYQACNGDAGYRLFAGVSIAAGAVGLLLLAGIALASVAARIDRRLLLTLFRAELYVAATVVTGLIVIHALIATVSMYACLSVA